MSDRIHSLTVVLEKDMRDDDVKSLKLAIAHMRGVLTVNGHVSDISSHMAEDRAKRELTDAILRVIREGGSCR
jgi:chromosome segregation and condensation protein ScpB